MPPRADRWLWPLALACGLVFLASLGRLWPLADADLTRPRAALVRAADSALVARGLAGRDGAGRGGLAPYAVATRLAVDEPALDYVERTYGRDAAQALVRAGAPLVVYDVLAKRGGDPDGLAVTLHPSGRVVGWSAGVQDDRPGAHLDVGAARATAARALAAIGVGAGATRPRAPTAADAAAPRDPVAAWADEPWVEKGAAARERPARTDHTFTYERVLDPRGDLRERAVAVVSGDRVTTARRLLVEPARGQRAARAREAPVQALQTTGFALLVGGVLGALAVFLTRLRDGRVRLARAAWLSALVFACAFVTQALGAYELLSGWDPLWPRWVATLADLGWRSQQTAWMFVVLFALVAAGDALDRGGPTMTAGDGARGATLWALGRGRIADPAVGLASARGFAVGLVCGGVMAATVALLVALGGFASVQPRGFFFYGLNASAPSPATLAFFTNIALLEELGYRFFAGRWLLDVTGRRWLAVLLPAVVYGLTHTGLSFLPPAEPFWGRALVMTLVGCVWGWAFLRYDALTVVTSHLTADLFIFNWPRLASAHPDVRAAAIATVAAPLLPAAVAGVAALARRRRAAGALAAPGGGAQRTGRNAAPARSATPAGGAP